MSYCSHQLLDYDPKIGAYRCRDCPVHFEARALHANWPREESSKPERKEPSRVLPIVGIASGLIFALAVLAVVYKTQIEPRGTKIVAAECPEPEITEKDLEKWQNRARRADTRLKECLERPVGERIVEVPVEKIVEVEKECPEVKGAVFGCDPGKICFEDQAYWYCPTSECPKTPADFGECPKQYKTEFQECMNQRGQAMYELEQCQNREAERECTERVETASCDARLKSANRKIEELRSWVSKLTLGQGQKCSDVAVSVPQKGCEKEIEVACGEIREALMFYYKKSKSQPGEEDEEGIPPYFGPDLKLYEELDVDEDEIEWDDDD